MWDIKDHTVRKEEVERQQSANTLRVHGRSILRGGKDAHYVAPVGGR